MSDMIAFMKDGRPSHNKGDKKIIKKKKEGNHHYFLRFILRVSLPVCACAFLFNLLSSCLIFVAFKHLKFLYKKVISGIHANGNKGLLFAFKLIA